MTGAAVRIWLKAADPAAITAREALQRALGYGRVVREVARSEVVAFRWEGNAEARAQLERLARETGLLLNPNKHRMEIAVEDETLHPRGNAWTVVSTPGEGAELARTLERHRLLAGEVPATRRGVLWELDLAAEGEELRRLAGEIAVARERKRGLLSNPHLEDAAVFVAPPRAADVTAALGIGTSGRPLG